MIGALASRALVIGAFAETRGSLLEQIMVENCLISDMVLSDTTNDLPPVAPVMTTPAATFTASPTNTQQSPDTPEPSSILAAA